MLGTFSRVHYFAKSPKFCDLLWYVCVLQLLVFFASKELVGERVPYNSLSGLHNQKKGKRIPLLGANVYYRVHTIHCDIIDYTNQTKL